MNTKTMLLDGDGRTHIRRLSPLTATASGMAFGRSQAPAPLEGTWVVDHPTDLLRRTDRRDRRAGHPARRVTPDIRPRRHDDRGNLQSRLRSRPAQRRQWILERTGRTSYQFAMQAFLNEPNAPYKTGLQRIEQTVELHTEDDWSSSGPVRFFETFDLSLTPGLVPYRAGCARATGVRLY